MWWENKTLQNKADELRTIDDKNYWHNQYVHQRHFTSCTKFAYYNQWCTIFNHPWSFDEIDIIEEKSIENWRQWPWFWWSSSRWADTVRQVMGKVNAWQIDVWSPEWDILMSKNRPIGISIIVDAKYWQDVSDWVLASSDFDRNYWHATTIKSKVGNPDMYEILDSVHGYRYDISKKLFFEMLDKWNVRAYWYVLLPKSITDVPTIEVDRDLKVHMMRVLRTNSATWKLIDKLDISIEEKRKHQEQLENMNNRIRQELWVK